VKTLREKAQILIEALPYLKKFRGKTVVIKYGGAAMIEDDLKKSVAEDLVLMKTVGIHPVVVHGGGPEISAAIKNSGKVPSFVNGLRVTDKETFDITEMVLVGKVNQQIVGYINRHGMLAAGVSGKDGHLLQVKKHRGSDKKGQDLGFVGEIEKVNTAILEALESQGFIPIIAPIGLGHDGNGYNCNADTVAGAVAAALKAEKLILMTDQPGILKNMKDPASLIHSLKLSEVAALIKKKIIDGGMMPKIEACGNALAGGTGKAHIIDGRVPHALLLEIFTDEGVGTEIVKAAAAKNKKPAPKKK
jgi:acetylglutamate kinase